MGTRQMMCKRQAAAESILHTLLWFLLPCLTCPDYGLYHVRDWSRDLWGPFHFWYLEHTHYVSQWANEQSQGCPRFLEPLKELAALAALAARGRGAEYSRFLVSVAEWINECLDVPHVDVGWSQKQAGRKQLPSVVFTLPLPISEEHLVCSPFGLIIVL